MALIQTAGTALTRSYQMLGQLTPPAYTMSDDQTSRGLIVLNGVLQSMQSFGPNVFRQTLASLTVSAGVPTVPVPGDVVGIIEARWVVSTTPLYERVLGRFQWVDYQSLPTKNAQGPPTVFMFDYQQDFTQLYVWPVPIISGTINCSTTRRAGNVAVSSDLVDLPPEWMLGLNYLVADALMDDQGMAEQDGATADRIKSHAAYWSQRLLDFDRPSSVFLRPYGKQNNAYGRYRRY
jgi:hypothetical protein